MRTPLSVNSVYISPNIKVIYFTCSLKKARDSYRIALRDYLGLFDELWTWEMLIINSFNWSVNARWAWEKKATIYKDLVAKQNLSREKRTRSGQWQLNKFILQEAARILCNNNCFSIDFHRLPYRQIIKKYLGCDFWLTITASMSEKWFAQQWLRMVNLILIKWTDIKHLIKAFRKSDDLICVDLCLKN